jgi:uncharacterized protein (DUF2141 family)
LRVLFLQKNKKIEMYINKILKGIIVVVCGTTLFNCAQFVPPTGGKKDEVPPKLLLSNPKMEQKNFKDKTIYLQFDELIDVTSLRQELLIIPEPESSYDIKSKSNSVILKFDKPFRDSTTYTFNFRKGIKDLNERNEAKNLKVVFSTGSFIDSLKIGGNVKSLLTNQPVLEANVALYIIQDSLNLKKTKPDYFIKTDSSGNYLFENIKNGKYRIYAFMDKNNNLKFDAKTEAIGFLKDTLVLDKNLNNININIYGANNEKPKNIKTLQRTDDYTILFDKNIKTFDIKFENKKDSIPYFGNGKELKFYNINNISDTLKVNISVSDSSENTLNYLQKIKFREQDKRKKDKTERFEIQRKAKVGEELEPKLTYELLFPSPIKEFDYSLIKIISDTIKEEKLEKLHFTWNHYKTTLTINKEVEAKREVRLIIPKGTFININGDSSENFLINNQILKAENYGLIEGSFIEKEQTKIIQLVNEKYEVIAEQTTKDQFLIKNIKPGIYLLRIIYDENQNKYWDFGNVESDILPEKIRFYEEPIKIKANFEIRGLSIK